MFGMDLFWGVVPAVCTDSSGVAMIRMVVRVLAAHSTRLKESSSARSQTITLPQHAIAYRYLLELFAVRVIPARRSVNKRVKVCVTDSWILQKLPLVQCRTIGGAPFLYPFQYAEFFGEGIPRDIRFCVQSSWEQTEPCARQWENCLIEKEETPLPPTIFSCLFSQ